MANWVYNFGVGRADGSADMVDLLGNKGANLAEMCVAKLPVPPGFTISAQACNHFNNNERLLPEGLESQVEKALRQCEKNTGRKIGSETKPLLLAVRPGSRKTIPGLMDTVLNLGLNDQTVEALAKESGDERFALDSYRRFIQMYSNVVLAIEYEFFEEILEEAKATNNLENDTKLTAQMWRDVITKYKAVVEEESGEPFPQEFKKQLWGAIKSGFAGWMSRRASTYRMLHHIPEEWGVAITIQSMVFGNLGNTSAAGMAVTRNPSTGANQLFGEYLVNAQGEDVLAGIRTPQNLTEEARIDAYNEKPSLEKAMPEMFTALSELAGKLEAHFRDVQDIEFTVENGQLWLLQTKTAKRTAKAALRIAVDMANEKLISRDDAVCRIDAGSLDQLLHPTIDPSSKRDIITSGLPASPGAATGPIVFSPVEAERLANEHKNIILVRVETSPEDIHGMHAAEGILTARGGMTSHAAVVARGMGKPCVSGAGSLVVDYQTEELRAGNRIFRRGDVITIDGSSGQVLAGRVAMQQPELSGAFGVLMEWADKSARMHVRTNAETPHDARTARSFGAMGIGLCRTEHMFFAADRIVMMREMILSETENGRRIALEKLLPQQRADFVELFEIMHGLPVTIRLLDPPLHEFLPTTQDEINEVAQAMDVDSEILRLRADQLHEFNPMLGHRGCRLAISYPEIVEMQARAIFEAAIEAGKRAGATVVPEVMVPLVSLNSELAFVKDRIDAIGREIQENSDIKFEYSVGTMIELPRAAVMAHKIAQSAEFFSFGTNDLTQTTFGMSRDDASSYLLTYERQGIVRRDPFVTLDLEGVGALMQIATEKGRSANDELKIGICGEHGGEPSSITFCENLGLDYVSCSPFRVPIARLACAQAAIKRGDDNVDYPTIN